MFDELKNIEQLKQGELARLIPVVADSSREQRITSALLAVMMCVDEFGKAMLKIIGAPASKTSKINCYTEVRLNSTTNDNIRPDGLIINKSAGRTWTALIEAKVDSAELKKEQVEAYLDLARENDLNAVITISNQFASLPTHHPLQVNKSKIRNLSLFHWSWTTILSEAVLISEQKGVSDPDQAYILNEFIRYLQHRGTGVNPFPRLGPGWKDVCVKVQQAVPLARNMDTVIDAVGEWNQLVEYLSLRLSMSLSRKVRVYMNRSHAGDPSKRLQDGITNLIKNNSLDVEFEVPDAASKILLIADISKRLLTASMRVNAPRDISRATASINWLLRQLNKTEDDKVIIKAIWPGRIQPTGATLGQVKENIKMILNANLNIIPIAFEVVQVKDIGVRFKGARTFVEDIVDFVPGFYGTAGQYLKNWLPPAPKIKLNEKEKNLSTEIINEGNLPVTTIIENQSID